MEKFVKKIKSAMDKTALTLCTKLGSSIKTNFANGVVHSSATGFASRQLKIFTTEQFVLIYKRHYVEQQNNFRLEKKVNSIDMH